MIYRFLNVDRYSLFLNKSENPVQTQSLRPRKWIFSIIFNSNFEFNSTFFLLCLQLKKQFRSFKMNLQGQKRNNNLQLIGSESIRRNELQWLHVVNSFGFSSLDLE